ncbi:hypothetical protein HDV00_010320 [Rhizophlyctis rosea]|nr:hypothetical protein HDV00_010320 [Rhizophlyctis rosea]
MGRRKDKTANQIANQTASKQERQRQAARARERETQKKAVERGKELQRQEAAFREKPCPLHRNHKECPAFSGLGLGRGFCKGFSLCPSCLRLLYAGRRCFVPPAVGEHVGGLNLVDLPNELLCYIFDLLLESYKMELEPVATTSSEEAKVVQLKKHSRTFLTRKQLVVSDYLVVTRVCKHLRKIAKPSVKRDPAYFARDMAALRAAVLNDVPLVQAVPARKFDVRHIAGSGEGSFLFLKKFSALKDLSLNGTVNVIGTEVPQHKLDSFLTFPALRTIVLSKKSGKVVGSSAASNGNGNTANAAAGNVSGSTAASLAGTTATSLAGSMPVGKVAGETGSILELLLKKGTAVVFE